MFHDTSKMVIVFFLNQQLKVEKYEVLQDCLGLVDSIV